VKTLALWVAVVVAVNSLPARAADEVEHRRGGVSALGLVLLGVGLGAVGLGFGGVVMSNDAGAAITLYAPGGITQQPYALFVSNLLARQSTGTTLAVAGFGGGAALLAGGLICLLLDAPSSRVHVGFLPTRDGATVTAALRF
jgi:hypothetical protein